MPNESEKQRRKALLHGLKAKEKAEAEAALPAPKKQLLAMFDWIDESSEGECDHSLRYTLEFIRAHGMNEERTVEWLRKHGGYCDCEVLMNVEDTCPAFE